MSLRDPYADARRRDVLADTKWPIRADGFEDCSMPPAVPRDGTRVME
jgi:hypothetical protein